MPLDDQDLEISYLSSEKQHAHDNRTRPAVSIHHIPSGITVQSSGTLSLQLAFSLAYSIYFCHFSQLKFGQSLPYNIFDKLALLVRLIYVFM